MMKRKILIFLIITFLWSWTNWVIGLNYLFHARDEEANNEFLKFFFIGVYGPSISAILVTLFLNGFNETISLLKKLFIWKIPLKNYLIVIIFPLLFSAVGITLYFLSIGTPGGFEQNAIFIIPAVLWAGLFAGPLGEELGWRGFLLPELQKKLSAMTTAVIIGFLWFIWHIPLFWAPYGTLVSGEPFAFLPILTYLIIVICLSCLYSWVVNNSKGSVLIAILFHLSTNAGIALLFFPELNRDFKRVHLLSSVPIVLFTIYIVIKTKLKDGKLLLN